MNNFYGKNFDTTTGLIEGSVTPKCQGSFIRHMDENYFYGVDIIEGKKWPWMRRQNSQYVKKEENMIIVGEDNDWYSLSSILHPNPMWKSD